MTSSNGNIFRVTGPLCGELTGHRLCVVNSPVTGEFHALTKASDARINGWVNNREAGDSRRHRAHYDVAVMPVNYTPEDLLFTYKKRFQTKLKS